MLLMPHAAASEVLCSLELRSNKRSHINEKEAHVLQLERPSTARKIKNEGDGDTVVEEVEWVSLGDDFCPGQGMGVKKKTLSRMAPRFLDWLNGWIMVPFSEPRNTETTWAGTGWDPRHGPGNHGVTWTNRGPLGDQGHWDLWLTFLGYLRQCPEGRALAWRVRSMTR